jgi:hypothetical protein
MTDLSEDIRAVIDAAAPPVTFAEVRARSRAPASGPGTAFAVDRLDLPARSSTSPSASLSLSLPGHRPIRRPVRILVATVAVLAVAAGTGTLIALGPRSRPLTADAARHHARSSDQPPSSVPPATVTGTPETLTPTALPSFFIQSHLSTSDCWDIVTSQGFTVDGSPPVVAWSGTGRSGTLCATQPATTAITYEGNGLGNGTGIDSTLAPAVEPVAGAATSVFTITQWPVAGETVFVWSDLPADAAYVTYTDQGTTLDWEAPVAGTAAFLVPQLFPAEAPFSVWHTTPLPVLSAYDAAGNLLGTAAGPRVTGDDLGMSPSGPG